MPNRLAQEKSPYLLQHADNPVAWYPWGHDAFEKAQAEQKPIFLSIGYSTCHWCHVMAHESFEDPAVAAILNEHFISVKVDREERPDVDRVYMTYVQAMTGHGGWPLSAWLSPDLKPFYGGTYYPPQDLHGRPSFSSLLRSITQAWQKDRASLIAEGERVIEVLRSHGAEQRQTTEGADDQDMTEAAGTAFESCFQYFYEAFDPTKGGFGSAPKFPRAANLNFIFRVAAIQGTDTESGREAIKMATFTLQRMAEGGIHDQVGGGFHRYSVDDSWLVPHFEKMLYDQAQIAVNYLEGYQASGREVYLWIARDTLDYVQRELTSPEGAFYSAEDADSLIEPGQPDHAEGAFYVWTSAQIAKVLHQPLEGPASGTLAELVSYHFGITAEGNVPSGLDPHGEFGGKNILAQRHSLADTAKKFGLDLEAANEQLLAALRELKRERDHRPRPHLDDKVIAGWNGLMISAFARASQVLSATGDDTHAPVAASYLAAGLRAAAFIRRELYDEASQSLYRSYRQGRATVGGFAEDYAYLIQGLLDLYEASFQIGWLQWAERLQEKMDTLFWDEAGGGYFNSAQGDSTIVLRLKDDYDGAEPAANSVAALNLLRLAVCAPDPEARTQQALRTLSTLRPQWTRAAQALPQALCALECALTPRRQVVIAGDPTKADFRALWHETQRRLGPRRSVFAADGAEGQTWLAQRATWIGEMKPIEGRATAYVCEQFICREPVTEPTALRAQLE